MIWNINQTCKNSSFNNKLEKFQPIMAYNSQKPKRSQGQIKKKDKISIKRQMSKLQKRHSKLQVLETSLCKQQRAKKQRNPLEVRGSEKLMDKKIIQPSHQIKNQIKMYTKTIKTPTQSQHRRLFSSHQLTNITDWKNQKKNYCYTSSKKIYFHQYIESDSTSKITYNSINPEIAPYLPANKYAYRYPSQYQSKVNKSKESIKFIEQTKNTDFKTLATERDLTSTIEMTPISVLSLDKKTKSQQPNFSENRSYIKELNARVTESSCEEFEDFSDAYSEVLEDDQDEYQIQNEKLLSHQWKKERLEDFYTIGVNSNYALEPNFTFGKFSK